MRQLCLFMLTISLYASEIRISEVMANPQGSEYENEFIEIYNPNDHVMHIKGWILSDGTGLDSITHMAGPELIHAKGYGLVLDPGYDLLGGIYSGLIPDSIPLYTISTDGTFGSGGLSNSGESVLIRNMDSSIVSSMSWDKSTDNGYSWERVDLNAPDSIAVWEMSLIENGTPGYVNSVTPDRFDLNIEWVRISESEDRVQVAILVHNHGSEDVVNSDLIIRITRQFDELHNLTRTIPSISSGDSLLWYESFSIDQCGWIQTSVQTQVSEDSDVFNIESYISCDPTPLIINEIMPIPPAAEDEWVEIFNRSSLTMNLRGWSIADNSMSLKTICDSSLYVMSGEYLLLLKGLNVSGVKWGTQQWVIDGFPTLNNSADEVSLSDPTDTMIDRIAYDETTGLVEGRSLERVRTDGSGSDNWRVSVAAEGSTPGSRNSLHLVELGTGITIGLDPNPFIASSASETTLAINLELPVEQAVVSVQVYDLAGREIAVPVPMQVVAHKSQLLWDGMAHYGTTAISGLYICRILIDDLKGNVSEHYEKLYLINE